MYLIMHVTAFFSRFLFPFLLPSLLFTFNYCLSVSCFTPDTWLDIMYIISFYICYILWAEYPHFTEENWDSEKSNHLPRVTCLTSVLITMYSQGCLTSMLCASTVFWCLTDLASYQNFQVSFKHNIPRPPSSCIGLVSGP